MFKDKYLTVIFTVVFFAAGAYWFGLLTEEIVPHTAVAWGIALGWLVLSEYRAVLAGIASAGVGTFAVLMLLAVSELNGPLLASSVALVFALSSAAALAAMLLTFKRSVTIA